MADLLKDAEDRVSQILNGGKCTTSEHEPLTLLEKMILLRALKIEFPHQSMALHELAWAVQKAAR